MCIELRRTSPNFFFHFRDVMKKINHSDLAKEGAKSFVGPPLLWGCHQIKPHASSFAQRIFCHVADIFLLRSESRTVTDAGRVHSYVKMLRTALTRP